MEKDSRTRLPERLTNEQFEKLYDAVTGELRRIEAMLADVARILEVPPADPGIPILRSRDATADVLGAQTGESRQSGYGEHGTD